MHERVWQFWIDVGGTFTDCLGRSPSGSIATTKVLSSAVVKGSVRRFCEARQLVGSGLELYPDHFFRAYRLRLLDGVGAVQGESRVADSFSEGGTLVLEHALMQTDELSGGLQFELASGEPAPILAIRRILRLRLSEPLGEIEVRLGTTRATNALLERRGARTALVTTKGFGDILLIANQDRPRLFELDIRKAPPLFSRVVEVEERMDAEGMTLVEPELEPLRAQLAELVAQGVEAIAICLLNSYRNSRHEELVAAVAHETGCPQVSVSSTLSPTIKMVPRGDTAVVDAYLSPVIRDYVKDIRASMPLGRLKLMTSAGGLVAAETASGKDTILSGPAGGVVALAEVSEAARLARTIGFDMGGTSSDVSRFSGELSYEYETEKAGVRIVSPMLAIETVAAGGGSICGFDGQKLVVGPRSAGADPGPACYGRGGPLALTDANLFLGRVLSEYFPFPLDADAVERGLTLVAERVRDEIGQELTLQELATGFVRIANNSMAAAIRRISVAKGYDVRDYALICFGGAGGQHACALARELGMKKVLVHPYAGVLSAWGMGVADVRRFAVMTVLEPLSPEVLRGLRAPLGELEGKLRDEVLGEGIRGDHLTSRVLLDLRYRGQSTSLQITEPAGEDWAGAFEKEHIRLYGHHFADREIEIEAARLEVRGAAEKASPELAEEEPRAAEPVSSSRFTVDGEWVEAPVFDRGLLRPGDTFAGPAIVVEATGTTVVDAGWSFHLSGRGDLELADEGVEATHKHPSAVSPVELEIFNSHFASIAEEMGATLRRTSLSVNVKERLDFSCAVFSGDGSLVANAPHMPVHLGAMSETVRQVLVDVPDLIRGDVIVTNDPFRGGSHLPDITVVTPLFQGESERPEFFTASRAHHAEIGGIRPGSMPPDSENLDQEGVLIRSFKLVEGGRPRFAELRRLLVGATYPSRSPDENLADLGAQVAANQLGVRRLRELMTASGHEATLAYMGHIQQAAEAKMRRSLEELQDGVYEFEDRLDEGSVVRVRIEILGDEAVLDFGGTSPPVASNLNANLAIVKAAVIYCFRCLIDEDIPLNEGVLAPLRLVVPVSLLNPPAADDPRQCPAVVGGNVETSQRVTDVILGALGLAAASQGTMNNLTFGDGSFGYYETICGGAGAGPGWNGAHAVHTHMTNTRLTDPEVLEARYPVRLRRFEIRQGSGGSGRFRGGDGCRREIEFLAPLEVSILSQRRTTRPFGLAGGRPGAAGQNTLLGADGKEVELGGVASFGAAVGDRLLIETPGGGGFGEEKEGRVSAGSTRPRRV